MQGLGYVWPAERFWGALAVKRLLLLEKSTNYQVFVLNYEEENSGEVDPAMPNDEANLR
jgi:hypothetical protein